LVMSYPPFGSVGTGPERSREAGGCRGRTFGKTTIVQMVLLLVSIPASSKRYDISGLYVTGAVTAQTLRFAARNAPRSGSAIRTRRPSRCTGRAPDSIRRRTVRGDTFKSSAASSMVRSLVRGRPRASVPVVRHGLRAGLEVRGVMVPTHPRYGELGAPALRSLEGAILPQHRRLAAARRLHWQASDEVLLLVPTSADRY
jgi:hypothetical protein